jgi:Na+/pantothenate symporter
MNSDSKVGVLDYVILGLILLISVVIGLFQGYHTSISRLYARLFQNRVDNSIDLEMTPEADEKLVESDETRHQQANTETSEYLTGNASMGAVPIAFSLLATFMSTNAVLGYPAEVYQYGVQIWIFAFGIATAPVIAALVIQPYFDKLNITSIFEYIEMRYKLKSLRLLTDVCYIARNFISGALYVLGPSTALTLILHLDKNFSIAMIVCINTSIWVISWVINSNSKQKNQDNLVNLTLKSQICKKVISVKAVCLNVV